MSNANGVLNILRAWNGECSPDRVYSLGVLCPGRNTRPDGQTAIPYLTSNTDKPEFKGDCFWLLAGSFNLPDGIVLSVPVTFTNDKWSLFNVAVGSELNERLKVSAM